MQVHRGKLGERDGSSQGNPKDLAHWIGITSSARVALIARSCLHPLRILAVIIN